MNESGQPAGERPNTSPIERKDAWGDIGAGKEFDPNDPAFKEWQRQDAERAAQAAYDAADPETKLRLDKQATANRAAEDPELKRAAKVKAAMDAVRRVDADRGVDVDHPKAS